MSTAAVGARRHAGLAPGVLWAVAGAASTALVLTGFVAWAFSPSLRTVTPAGPDALGDAQLALMRALELFTIVVFARFAWRHTLGPLVRERTLTPIGTLTVATLLMCFFDPLDNFTRTAFAYSTHFVNVSAWVQQIPGWNDPDHRPFVQPVLFALPAYVVWHVTAAIMGSAILHRLRALRPGWSTVRRLACLFALFVVLDAINEIVFIRLGFMAYPGVPQSLSLWPGTVEQFPLYEPLLMGAWWMGMAILHHFRDDEGRTLAERGIAGLRAGPHARAAIGLLAVVGFLHVWALVVYFVPFNLLAARGGTVTGLPSHLREGVQSRDACPGVHVLGCGGDFEGLRRAHAGDARDAAEENVQELGPRRGGDDEHEVELPDAPRDDHRLGNVQERPPYGLHVTALDVHADEGG